MSSQLTYDPRSKKLIRDTLYDFLYQPVNDSFQKRLDTIIEGNSLRMNNAQQHMLYQGELYSMSKAGVVERPTNRCHQDILPLMKDYVEDLDRLNQKEVPYVLGYITQVLNSSESLQDYLKLLPESVHNPLKKLSCPYKHETLKPDRIEAIQEKNHQAIALIKQRMVENLLL